MCYKIRKQPTHWIVKIFDTGIWGYFIYKIHNMFWQQWLSIGLTMGGCTPLNLRLFATTMIYNPV